MKDAVGRRRARACKYAVSGDGHRTVKHSDLLSVGQVVERLLAERRLRGVVAFCALPVFRVDNHWRFRRRDLDAWIRRQARHAKIARTDPAAPLSVREPVVWFLSRGDQPLRLDARYDDDTEDYVLVVHWPDGRQETERFADAPAFRQRLVELENGPQVQRIRADAAVILPHRCPDRRLM